MTEDNIKKRATMQDIARGLNLSISTVSRAFMCADSVKPSTRKKIIRLSHKLNYTPNLNARALVSKKTRLIGFILGSLSNEPLPALVNELHQLFAGKEYDLHLALSFNDPKTEEKIIDMMTSRTFEGIIINSPIFNGKYPAIERIINNQIPCVIDGYYDARPINQVCGDFRLAGKIVTEHFVELGHKRIAFIYDVPFDPRLEGYKQVLIENGLVVDDNLIVFGDKAHLDAEKIATYISKTNATAVFACYDGLAVTILRGLNKIGIKVPNDIALAGIGNEKHTDLLATPLTTYKMHYKHRAEHLVNMMLNSIENPGSLPHKILLPGELIARKSTLGCCCINNCSF